MDTLLNTATEAATMAADRIFYHYNTIKERYKGAPNNVVTQADLAAQECITSHILSVYPDHAILAEENGAAQPPLDADNLWIIDPLDGTNNYSNHIPHFSISIAYAQRGQVRMGLILDPCRNELFSAIDGQGARLNGLPIVVSAKRELAHAIIATGFYYDRGALMEKTLRSIHTLYKNNIRDIRRMGSAALDLAWTAAGRLDGYFEYRLSVWDFAAGMILVREAGGICSNGLGDPMDCSGIGIIAANKPLHAALIPLLTGDSTGEETL